MISTVNTDPHRFGGEEVRKKARAVFLEALKQGASVSRAAREAGVHVTTAYNWRKAKNGEKFRAEWDVAVEEGTDRLEDAMFERAVDGYDRPVFQGGTLVGVTREYSDQLAMFLAQGRRPEKFRRKGENGEGVQEVRIVIVGGLPKEPDPVATVAEDEKEP